jgi:hypothetical protein
MRRSGVWIGYASVVALGAVLAVGVGVYWLGQYAEVRHHYIENAASNTRFVADKVEVAFASIYQNLRTLSLLPSVRGIDRHGTNLSDEAKTTIQQVYLPTLILKRSMRRPGTMKPRYWRSTN